MKRQIYQLTLLIISCLIWLQGCASSATPQTMPWQSAIQPFSLKPVSPGMYQLDQIVVTYEALDDMLERAVTTGQQPNIIIISPLLPMHEEEIRIAELAEKHGLSVYTSGLFRTSKTSSEKIRTHAEEMGYGEEG